MSEQLNDPIDTSRNMVFISYAWGGENEEFVNELDKAFSDQGITIYRDKREIRYTESISAFVQQIGDAQAVILIISDKYLRSPNCMRDLLNVDRSPNLQGRVFPIVLSSADIYSPVKRLGYVKYWDERINELNMAIQQLENKDNLPGIMSDLARYSDIRDSFDRLVAKIADTNTMTPDMHREEKFSTLIRVVRDAISRQQTVRVVTPKQNPPGVEPNVSKFAATSQQATPDISPTDTENVESKATETPVPEVAAAIFAPPVAGYISDRIHDEAPDLLDIEREVANIASVLTFKQVQPPLALGLFGDWGSGKSFFMGKLRKYISQVASHYQKEEQTAGMGSLWCSRVAQIDFNAWHFSDSNLWASLVTRIYEGLDRELNQEKETAEEIKKKIIEAQIVEARERSIKAETQLDLARERVSTAEMNLEKKKKNREGKENELLGMIGQIPKLLDQETRQQLDNAASSLGVPEAGKTFEALESLSGELQGMSGRTKAVFLSVLYSPMALVGMAAFIVLLPGLLTLAVETWGEQISAVGRNVIEVSGVLLSVIVWLHSQVRRGLGLVGKVESALEKAKMARQERIETDEEVRKAKEELTVAQAEEQAAHAHLEGAKTELQRLQDELQELRPERKLQRLIEARSSTGAYAQHLGIISLIRSDFEMMSNILNAMANDKERDYQKAPPIQRIILYVDDLDRCKPERVVEVLEAIHLLLFFPLFVVVVAVDPRWLRHSLAQHYPATLSANDGGSVLDRDTRLSLYSTPQDYLEKIFQIPFALRPVDKGGYQGLVKDLLKPLPQLEQHIPEDISATNLQTREVVALPIGQTPEANQSAETVTGQPLVAADHKEDESFKPIPPRQLEFTQWEQDDIQQLWILFRTPRTVKRFINIYRLLRAGLVSDSEVKVFEGEPNQPGDYQVALLLLAAITAFPNEANRLLFRLDAWLDVEERNRERPSTTTWNEILDFLKAENAGGADGSVGSDKDVQLRRQMMNIGSIGLDKRDQTKGPESSWILMLDCVDRVVQNKTWKSPFAITTLRTWVLRVARFSFSIQPT